jgi:hypothetical protein
LATMPDPEDTNSSFVKWVKITADFPS